MTLEPYDRFIPNLNNNSDVEEDLPIFNIERVQLQFSRPSDFVAAQVANNAIILAFTTGRLLRIDLEDAGEIEDIDLPKKSNEIGTIRNLFLDPTASHLIITTSLSENFYLHSQSKTPKHLSRLKGVNITSVGWNLSQPTATTRQILLGCADGNLYETFIEPQPEFYRREEKYVRNIYKTQDGPIIGIRIDKTDESLTRQFLLATPTSLLHWIGKVSSNANEGTVSIFSKLFETETPTIRKVSTQSKVPCVFTISPEPSEDATSNTEQTFAWLSSDGILHGDINIDIDSSQLGDKLLSEAKLLQSSQIPPAISSNGKPKISSEPTLSVILTPWHIIQLVEGRIVATNKLDDTVVLDHQILEPGQTSLGLFSDSKKHTYWLITTEELFEIRAEDESRDIWKIMLKAQKFDSASQYATTPEHKDAVATASGDYLVGTKHFMEAAAVYGRSTKPFEQVALTFIDNGENDALRKYLLTKLSTLSKAAVMQKIMVATWLVELFMSKLNDLDDTIITKAELVEDMNQTESKHQLDIVKQEFHEFINTYHENLNLKTTYEVINAHGREEELLYFANIADDYDFILSYWIQRERWDKSLQVIKKQTDSNIFYKYSSVLIANSPEQFIDILMRQTNLDSQRLIPALLNYNKLNPTKSIQANQAIRYLNFIINIQGSTNPAIHNTLISILTSSPSEDESALLTYLKNQSYLSEPLYDSDFALRLCIQHNRTQACVHIYTSMSQYSHAVDLALKHNAIDLASQVADQSTNDAALRKKLWLKIAKTVIANSPGNIKTAINFLNRCELLRIEDLIPFFPDFVIIDDFKEEICLALEEYSKSIDSLKREMDEAALTANNIKSEIKALDHRYAIVEPGEKCWICRLPLLVKQFFVFPCQHSFHSECLGNRVIELAGPAQARKIRNLQAEVQRTSGKKREQKIKELDGVVAGGCVLCSWIAIKQIDEPFITPQDNKEEWAL